MKVEKATVSGLTLDNPYAAVPKASPVFAVGLNTVVLLLAATAAIGCFFTAFELEVYWLPVVCVGAVCALLCSVQQALGRYRWIAVALLAACWLAALRLGWHSVQRSGVRAAAAVLSAYGERLGLDLPEILVPYTSPRRGMRQNTWLASLLMLPLCRVLYWSFVRRRSTFGSFLLTGAFLLVPLVISIVPAIWAVGMLLVFWSLLLFIAPIFHPCGGREIFDFAGSLFAQPGSLCLLAVLFVCVFGLYHCFPPKTYERPHAADEIRALFTEKIKSAASLFDGGYGVNDRLELSGLGSRVYSGEIALSVRHEWQGTESGSDLPKMEMDYLKSFVGSVYTGKSWERLSDEESKKIESALSSYSAQTLPAALSTAYYSQSDIHNAYIVSVKNASAPDNAVYAPYGLYSGGGLPEGVRCFEDGYLTFSGVASGRREYEFSAVATPDIGITMPERFAELLAWNAGNVFSGSVSLEELLNGGTLSIDGSDALSQFEAEYDIYLSGHEGELFAAELWRIPEWAKQLLPSMNFTLLESVESYSELVYEQYTRLPDSTRAFLDAFLRDNEYFRLNELNGESPAEIFELLKNALNEHCRYTLSPQPVPKDCDFVQYFLENSREGYCVHFATAAVAVLRYMGIPARYAEGYVVPVGENGEWVNVPDSSAHAWAEVYFSGTGWLPVEFTPAAAALNNVADTITPTAVPSMQPVASPAPMPPETAATPTPTAASSTPPAKVELIAEVPPGKVSVFGFITVLVVVTILAAVAFELQRRIRISLREIRFAQPDRNRAALSAYAYLLRLQRETSHLQNAPVHDREAEELALKARFSRQGLNEAEVIKITAAAAELALLLKMELPLLAKLKCKYILALF